MHESADTKPEHPETYTPATCARRLTEEEYGEIYTRYFMRKHTMEEIASALDVTRVTVLRCLKRQRAALEAMCPDLGHPGRPIGGRHYARYRAQVLAAFAETRGRRQHAASAHAAEFIAQWWKGQHREAKAKRWMDAGKLFQRYTESLETPTNAVSYKTFTRLMRQIIGEAYVVTRGRPVTRRRRKRSSATGEASPSPPPPAAEA